MGSRIEHHRSVEYRRHDLGDIAGFSVAERAGRDGVDVSGVCPGCGGGMSTYWGYGSANGYKGPGDPGPGPADRWRTISCECGFGHRNRPDSAEFAGCGAFWRIELP
jgi:hypothetical protein